MWVTIVLVLLIFLLVDNYGPDSKRSRIRQAQLNTTDSTRVSDKEIIHSLFNNKYGLRNDVFNLKRGHYEGFRTIYGSILYGDVTIESNEFFTHYNFEINPTQRTIIVRVYAKDEIVFTKICKQLSTNFHSSFIPSIPPEGIFMERPYEYLWNNNEVFLTLDSVFESFNFQKNYIK